MSFAGEDDGTAGFVEEDGYGCDETAACDDLDPEYPSPVQILGNES